jgi:hypothetical protein
LNADQRKEKGESNEENVPFLNRNKQHMEPPTDMKRLHASWFAYFDTESDDEESSSLTRYYHTKESK